jgi:2-keto-4-pentenoate hydratase/2-oxohepta-3-ene-1,7-dioic acid hydratase in catechol pathway
MKIARIEYNKTVSYACIDNAHAGIFHGSIYDDNAPEIIDSIDIKDARLLAPVEPTKIVCLGLNYREHAAELDMDIPKEPVIFLKPPSSIIGPDDSIIYPAASLRLDYEAELAIIVKKRARSINAQDVKDYILGYTCLNDITARDIQKRDGQWTRAKSFDTFCPIGPHIETCLDTGDIKIKLSVNNNIKQSSSTSDMIFDVDYIISFVSGIMTLMPGDIVTTGTPKGVGPLTRGDIVNVEIDGIGCLTNKVV